MLESLYQLFAESALWVLFFTGFLSATLLPGGSEASLLATLATDNYLPSLIILVATAGNTLGGLTNYWLGLLIPNRTRDEKHGHRAIAWISRYGYGALFFSWLPVIGDPICLAAGWLRMKFLPTVIIITLGKAVRYSVLTALFFGFF